MAFDFAAAKYAARQVVHETLGVAAFYQDHTMSAPEPIRVRWHSKINRFGDLDGAGYAEVIEGIHRVILEEAQARLLNVRHGGVITITMATPNPFTAELVLDSKEPADGPYEEIWTVTKS